jgi:hypothetical protein
MKADAKGLEVEVKLTEEEFKRLKLFPIEGKISGNAVFTLVCRKEQREWLELNTEPKGYIEKADVATAIINGMYYKKLGENKNFEVRYHSGAGKFKVSIIN